MGIAAYHRGSAVISRQIRDELGANRLVPVDRYHIQALEDHNASLTAEVARLRARLDRAMTHLSERRATLAAERRDRAEVEARLLDRARSAERAMLAYRRQWEGVSRLLRRLSLAKVREVTP
jgi:predicted  nucleic acid-binding Zn-ribbon protein